MTRSRSTWLMLLVALCAFVAAAPSAKPQRAASPPASPAPSSPAVVPSLGPPSTVPSPNVSQAASFDLGVWTVHASSIDANFKTGNFSTPAKVLMTRIGGDVTADRANGNYKKQLLFLNGHVIMHDTQGDYGGLAKGAAVAPQGNPSTLTADKAQIDGAAKLYKAIGNVHYVQGTTVVDADTGTLNNVTHDLLLEGKVHVADGQRSMSAARVIYNTITGIAHAVGDVTLEFPNEVHKHLATPKPIKIPKNALTQPVASP